MEVGIRKRLLCTCLLISLLAVATFEIFIIGNIHRYYLNSVSSTLQNKAELASRFYNNFLDFGDIYSNSQQTIDLFAERSFQLQITDKNGTVIADSLGIKAKNNLDYEDVKIALTGKNSEFKGSEADSGEKIYAYTVPLTSNGMIVGTMRFTTSLEQTYQVIYKLTLQLLAFGVILLFMVLVISVFLVRKNLVGLLVAVCIVLMFFLIPCIATDPVQTMRSPAVIDSIKIDTSKTEILSQVKKLLPAEAELLKITSLTEQKRDWLEIDLTGDEQGEFLLGYRDKDEKIGVIILQKNEQGFKKLYMKTFDNYDYQWSFDKVMAIKTAPLINNKLAQVVVSYNFYAANYNSLSVHILGYDAKEKVIKNYFSLQDLPQADMKVQTDRLIISAMGISKEYKWDGSKFTGRQIYEIPEVNKNDVVIHYAMNKKGLLTVSEAEVVLNVGQRLLLIRDDKLDLAERIMQGGDDPSFVDILDFTAEKVYTAQKPGIVHITIVPNGGYDWDNAKEITVTVR